MNVIQILFLTLSFTIVELMVLQEEYGETAVDFPELKIDDPTFKQVGDCGSITGCLKVIGYSVFNVAVGLVFFVTFIGALLLFILEFFGLLLSLTIEGIPGAPWYANLLITGTILGSLSLIIYKMARSGESES